MYGVFHKYDGLVATFHHKFDAVRDTHWRAEADAEDAARYGIISDEYYHGPDWDAFYAEAERICESLYSVRELTE